MNTAVIGLAATVSHDEILRQWCLEDDQTCPPRLCEEDLLEPERFRQRLEAWILTQC